MTCRPWRWLWGLIPLALIALLVILGERGNIERDLTERAHGALGKAGLGTVHASFNGRDGVVSGTFYDEGTRAEALRTVRGVWGVRAVADRAKLLDKVEPYSWSATRRDGRIRLKGYIHSEADRKTVIGIARASFPGLEIDDRMKLARGGPGRDVWLGCIGFGLEQLGHLREGQVRLTGDRFTLLGEAASSAAYRTVHRRLKRGLPFDLRLAANRVVPPRADPYVWSAVLEGGRLVLEGHVPDGAIRARLATLARHVFSRQRVTDRTEFASGAPDQIEQAASVALRNLARLEKGRVTIRGVQLDFAGLAEREEVAKAVAKAVRTGLPAHFRSTEAVKFRKPTLPMIADYSFTVTATPARVVLAGYTPGEGLRKALRDLAAKRFPGRTVEDRLALGAGAPKGFAKMARLAIESLAGLESGRATLRAQKLAIEGASASRRIAGEIEARLAGRRMAGFETKVAIRLRESAPDWRAALDGRTITLSGEVPDRASRQRITALAARSFPGRRVVDRMRRVDAGDTTQWMKVVSAGLRMLSRLAEGQVTLVSRRLQVSGEARAPADMIVIREWVSAALPSGFSGEEDVRLRPRPPVTYDYSEIEDEIFEWAASRREAEERRKAEADERARREAEARKRAEAAEQARRAAAARAKAEAEAAERARRAEAAEQGRGKDGADGGTNGASMVVTSAESGERGPVSADVCQKMLDSITSHGVIRFRTASADLAKDSHATLDALARAVKRCPDVSIEIAGHTDSDGSANLNQRLSELRARSVVAYLTGRGVSRDRLHAVGYGETRPVAPNDTPANKARNRRIEFTVKTRTKTDN